MKTAIIAKQGAGATTFIKNIILPGLKNYLIFDFVNEFTEYENRVTFDEQSLQEIRDTVIKSIEDAPYSCLLILPDALCFLSPRKDKRFGDKLNYDWLTELLHDKQFVINTTSIRQYTNIQKVTVDKIYVFDTGNNSEMETFKANFPVTEVVNRREAKLTQ